MDVGCDAGFAVLKEPGRSESMRSFPWTGLQGPQAEAMANKFGAVADGIRCSTTPSHGGRMPTAAVH